MTNKQFLNWVADRIVHVYGESANVDFVQSLRERAEHIANVEAELASINIGKVVVVPQSLEHAQAMHLIATAAMKSPAPGGAG